MTLATIETKIWYALRDKANAYPALPFVAYPNDEFTAPTDGNGLASEYWIFDDLRFDVPRKYTDTGGSDGHSGEFQIHVMMPLRFNYELQRQTAGLLADYFAKDSRLEYDGVVVNIIDRPKTTTGSYRDGAYNRLPLLIRWRASS